MAKLQSLDPHTPMFRQFQERTGPIVLANTFAVPRERTEEFLALFRRQAEFMKRSRDSSPCGCTGERRAAGSS